MLARLIEPTSTLQSVHVLRELGLPSRHVATLYEALRRASERDYRSLVESACVGRGVWLLVVCGVDFVPPVSPSGVLWVLCCLGFCGC